MNTDTTVDGSEQNQSDSAESTVDYKADLAALKEQNAELLNGLRSLQAAQTKPVEEKQMSKEDFAKLLTDDPRTAFSHAFKGEVAQVEKNLTQKQQATYYDEKAERDFPLITKDTKFQQLVKSETQRLISAGTPKDSPMLVYIAAENAALKYKGSQETTARESKTSSGEGDKSLPKNFDKMAAMFNLSDKAKEKAKENFAYRAELEARKNRG